MVDEKGLDGSIADKIGEYVRLGGGGLELVERLLTSSDLGKNKSAAAGLEDMKLFLKYRYALMTQALFLCTALFPSKKENVHLFFSSLPNFDKCHETSQIFTRTDQTFVCARSFGVTF